MKKPKIVTKTKFNKARKLILKAGVPPELCQDLLYRLCLLLTGEDTTELFRKSEEELAKENSKYGGKILWQEV